MTYIVSPKGPDAQAPGTALAGARAAPPGHRPAWAEIDLDAIAANVAALRAHASSDRFLAVVKADGYGHGLVEAARAAVAGGADTLGVALVEEGETLRAAGVTAPVLVLTEPPAAAADALLDASLTPTVYSRGFADAVDEAAARRGERVPVHLKLDTGMRRVGVPQDDWEDALRHVRAAEGLHLEGLWSHFAVADEPAHPFIAHQTDEFERGLALARRLGVEPEVAHLANSAATLDLPDTHHDMVRPGLAVYGLEPAPGLAGPVELRPALAVRARLSLVKALAKGEAVSYGLTWAPEQDTRLGTVPLGYADGVPRLLGNRAAALVDGRRVAYAGRVCMDQFCVDLGPDADAAAGDEVTLIGAQGIERVTAEEWAEALGTVNYEIITRLGARLPRVHVGSAGVE